MGTYKDLLVFKKAFDLAMQIFEISKTFPKEECYSLTDQVRRSSRSVCANFWEAYRRRKYIAHFKSKLSDCDAEHTETEIWIEFAKSCNYLNEEQYKDLIDKSEEIGRLLGAILREPSKYM